MQATKADHIRADYLTIIPRVRVGYEMVVANEARSAELATIILYQPSESGIIVLLKTSAKYREFLPTLVVKTTNSAFFLNFEQTRTVTIFGGHSMAFIIHSKYFPDSDWLKANV